MQTLAIIPARYASTRFPGKPLAMIAGKSMLQHVFEKVKNTQLFDAIIIATDDDRIFQHATSFGAKVLMTAQSHQSGTDRCGEVIQQTDGFDVVVNIQGDEPFVAYEQLKVLLDCFKNKNTQIATLIKKINSEEELFNQNIPKVVIKDNADALYFSRNTLPFIRNAPKEHWLTTHTFYKHIGIYAYQKNILAEIVQLPMGPLEQAESLEQLRWLEHGYQIQTAETAIETIAIDSPEDLEKAIDFYHKKQATTK